MNHRSKMMKQRIVLVAVASMVTFNMLACRVGGITPGDSRMVRGSGHVVEETRAVSDFAGVELATPGTLHIEVSDREALRIEAEDNLIKYLETEVRNGRLRIETQDNVSLHATQPIHYYLTVTGLDTIVISSSGDIKAPDLEAERFSITIASSGNLEMGDLETDTLTVVISSSGNVTMGVLNADTLEVDIRSSGNLDIAGGKVETQNVIISSSGNCAAQGLESAEAKVHLSSNGSAAICVRDHLRAHLSSSGNLRYIGNPTVDVTTTSSGTVEQIGE